MLRCLLIRCKCLPALVLALACCRGHASAQTSDDQLALHQQRAQEAEARQDFGTAIREYQLLVRALPRSAELVSNLGVALYFHKDYVQSEATLRRAIALKPALYAPHLFLGLALAHDANPDAAVQELQKAKKLNDGDPIVHTWLGYEYSAQMRFGLALDELKQAAQLKPDDPDLWFALGRCHLELARTETEELLKVAPDDARTWQLAGEQYEAQGNRAKAVELYTIALQKKPDLQTLREKVRELGGGDPAKVATPDAPSTEPEKLYAEIHRNEEESRAAFEQLEKTAPNSYRVHQVLGDAAVAADRYDDAIQEYRAVIAQSPDLPGIHGDLCNALSRTAQIDDAIKECKAELKLSPFSAEALVQTARVLLLKDDDDDAEPLLQKAKNLDHCPTTAYKLLGKIDLTQHRDSAAIKALSMYVAIEKQDASAWFLLARAYKADGDESKANQAITEYKHYFDRSQRGLPARKVLQDSREEDASAAEDLTGAHPL